VSRSVGDSPVSWVVVLMAASSLVMMICLLQIDRIVDGDLYGYGLRFSSSWAGPYSSLVWVAFVLGWFNIVAAVGVHLYSITFRRKEVEMLVREAEIEMRRQQVEELRAMVEPPILPGLPEHEALSKSRAVLEREKEMLTASAEA